MKKVISTTIILSLLLSLFTFTVSANKNETVNVLINKSINFKFMDEEFIPYDSSINAIVYPITYKARTYIPARFLAEAIGFEVTWDETTQTVGFNDGGVEKVNEAKHGDRTSHNDTALLNKNIKFTVNGEPFVPMEADGSICYPLTYKGRTYIPARFIAEKAGLSVNWDGATQTIKLDYNETTEDVEIQVPTTPTQPTTPIEPTTPTPTTPETTDIMFEKATEITKAVLNGVNITLNGQTPMAVSKLPEIMSFIHPNCRVITVSEENITLDGNTLDFKDNSEIEIYFEAVTDFNAFKDYLKKNINTNIYVAQKTDAMAFHLGDKLTLIVDFAPCRITIGTKTTFPDYMYNDMMN